MALLEDGRVSECHIERRGQRSVVGHVWKGKVESVLAGMEACFIDVGLAKNGFLHVDEVVALGVPKHKRQIADLVRKGDQVIVQAIKDPMGTKGARLTMQLSLAGRFLVYVPYGDGVGVSKRLADEERQRLRKICGALVKTSSGGVIVRTAAAGVSEAELQRDHALLVRLWAALQKRAEQVKAPSLLYSEADVSLRIVRDLFRQGVDEVLVDEEEQHRRLVEFLRRTSPELADRVRLYEGKVPMMRAFGVDKAVRSTLNRRAPLPSGGYLVIDDTEAMTVIDVNTGRHVGKGSSSLEETITRTNLEAAAEVVRQLRLRDIGGIVIIDFIDMEDRKNRAAVKKALEQALEADRSRTYVVDISPLGLVEMTRQNISDGPREILTEPCPSCEGTGYVVTDETHAIEVEREVREALAGRTEGSFVVGVHPRVAALLREDGGARLTDLEEDTGKAL
ncbi:MAG: Rne/Rng family ribonuclease, partial [Actinomycetota bacterium]